MVRVSRDSGGALVLARAYLPYTCEATFDGIPCGAPCGDSGLCVEHEWECETCYRVCEPSEIRKDAQLGNICQTCDRVECERLRDRMAVDCRCGRHVEVRQ